MKLDEMSMKSLLALHNAIAVEPAGPKTFATRGKLIARIEAIAEAKCIDLASFRQTEQLEASEQHTEPHADAAESPDTPPERPKKPSGKGIGALARGLLLDHTGWPHAIIAEMVNVQIEGARATANSVRWYACDLRKKGVEVPARQKSYPAEMTAEQSAEWLAGVRVVEPGEVDEGQPVVRA